MTARVGSLSVDGSPISQADLHRLEAEEALHADWQRRAVRVVAGSAKDVHDCRLLLDILGLDRATVTAAAKPRRPRPGRSSSKVRKTSSAGAA
ncbi:MAG: hypothetical protein QOD45_293 [Pseudonocardiales bacterium]|nr:hypothetical protein [Pseudonocardiales bacterium]